MRVDYISAEEKDIPLLLELMKDFYILEHLPYDPDILVPGLKKLFSNKGYGIVWLIYLGDTPAGYIAVTYGYSFEYQGITAIVDEFFIMETFRGKGIGKKTLEFVESYLSSEGIKAFHLEVDRKNTTAQEVYRKFGFKDHDRYLLTKWIS